jgi:hypothetical protein
MSGPSPNHPFQVGGDKLACSDRVKTRCPSLTISQLYEIISVLRCSNNMSFLYA